MQPGIDVITVLLGILKLHQTFFYLHLNDVKAIERFDHLKQKVNFNISITDSVEVVQLLKAKYKLYVKKLSTIMAYLIIFNNNIFENFPKKMKDVAYIVTTSGSTGEPKIVYVPDRCIVPNITHMTNIFDQNADDICLLSSPLTFDPSYVQIFTSLYCGSCLLIVDESIKSNSKQLFHSITEKHQITILHATPSLLSLFQLKMLRWLFSNTSHLRVLALGGEKCPGRSILKRWKHANNKTKIFNLYGITEVSCWATYHEIQLSHTSDMTHQEGTYDYDNDDDEVPYDDDDDDDDEVPLGKVLEGTILEIRKCDDDNDDGDRSEVDQTSVKMGIMWIGGHERVCWIDDDIHTDDDDGETRNINEPIMRCSGDIVKMEKDELFYVGRSDDVIKRMGKKINLSEFPQILCKLATVNSSMTLYMDNQLVVFVQLVHNDLTTEHDFEFNSNGMCYKLFKNEEISKDVYTCIRSWLPVQYFPDDVVCISSMPLTHHGKVDRRKLRTLYKSYKQSNTTFQCSSIDDALQYFYSALSERLNISKVDLATNLNEKSWVQLGGDSIGALSISTEMSAKFSFIRELLLDTLLSGRCVKEAEDYIISCFNNGNFLNGARFKRNQSELNEEFPTYHNFNTSHKKLKSDKFDVSDVSCALIINRFMNIVRFIYDGVEHKTVVKFHSNKSLYQECRVLKPRKKMLNKTFTLVNESATLSIEPAILLNQPATMLRKPATLLNEPTTVSNDHTTSLKLSLKWSYNTGKCVDASPLIIVTKSVGTVYIGSHSFKFASLDLYTGVLKWVVELDDRVEASACSSLCTDYIITACYSGNVYKISSHSGEIIWKHKTNNSVKCSPCLNIQNGFVYIGSHDGCVYALDIINEKCVWSVDLQSGSIFSSPCINYWDDGDCTWNDDLKCDVDDDGGSACDDGNDATHVSHCNNETSEMNEGLLMGTDDVGNVEVMKKFERDNELIVCTLAGLMCGINTTKGQIQWKHNMGKPIFSSPIITKQFYVVGCVDNYLYAIDKLSHNITWRYKTAGPIFSTAISITTPPLDEILIIGSHDHHLHCINAQDGRMVWKSRLDSEVYSTPCLLDIPEVNMDAEMSYNVIVKNLNTNHTYNEVSMLAVCSTKGWMYVLDIHDGSIVTRYHLNSEVFSSPCYVGGMIVVGCRDNNVYCFTLSHDQ